MVRRAWGRMTLCMVCHRVIPMDVAASIWPLAMDWNPARKISPW